MSKNIKIDRRDFLQVVGGLGAAGLWASYGLIPKVQGRSSAPYKVLQIFLDGGWDSALATDPVVGSKVSGGSYAEAYQNYTVSAVSQKPNLLLGPGLLPAGDAFASMNTCFINGIFMEVTAHELAKNYVYSGTMSLSRSREYPAFLARMGDTYGAFPPFVALGNGLPLGSTSTNPPLHSRIANQLKEMLNPFENVGGAAVQTANKLVDDLNALYDQKRSSREQELLQTWYNSQSRIDELYQQKYNLTLTDQIKSDFSVNQEWEDNANFPVAFLALASGISPYVTISLTGFDTHTGHFDSHLPLLEGFSQRLNTLVAKMKVTPDPDYRDKMLSETTLIVVMSEFVRTPQINAGGGTDHWQSSSMILMGEPVTDNLVVGKTDDEAHATGWNGSQAVTFNEETRILPEHVTKSIIRKILPDADHEELGERTLDGIFKA